MIAVKELKKYCDREKQIVIKTELLGFNVWCMDV